MRIVLKEKFTHKGSSCNEDGYFLGENLFLVMDGATGLGKSIYHPSDAAWLVSSFKRNFCEELPFLEECRRISAKCYQNFKKRGGNCSDIAFMPTMGIVGARLENNILKIILLGDLEAHIPSLSLSFFDTRLPSLDALATKRMMQISEEKGISPKEARKEIQEELIAHRRLANQENGYSVFSLMEQPSFSIITKEVPVLGGEDIYLASDGFMQLYRTFHKFISAKEMFESSSLSALYPQLKEAAKEDPLYYKYPRFKYLDDATCLHLRVEN